MDAENLSSQIGSMSSSSSSHRLSSSEEESGGSASDSRMFGIFDVGEISLFGVWGQSSGVSTPLSVDIDVPRSSVKTNLNVLFYFKTILQMTKNYCSPL